MPTPDTQHLWVLLQQHFNTPSGCQWQQHGYFSYLLNGSLTDIIEPWRLGVINKSDTLIIQSLRHSSQYQVLLTADWQQCKVRAADSAPPASTEQCRLTWQQGAEPGVAAHYQLTADRWRYQQAKADQSVFSEHPVVTEQGDIGGPFHFFPLLRIFSGAMVLALQQAPTRLLLPDIELGTAAADKLRPKLDWRQSHPCETSPSLDAGLAPTEKRRCFTLSGGHYREDNALFQLDSAGLLQSYQWQQDSAHHWLIRNHLLPPSLGDAVK